MAVNGSSEGPAGRDAPVPGPTSLSNLVPKSDNELVAGVVIDLPEPVAGELRAARKSLGDVEGAQIHPHITLLPPRLMLESTRGAAREHLSEVASRTDPFRLDLVGTGTFRPVSPVAYVGVGGELQALHRLQQAVCSGPLAGGLAFAFHPHVTLAHAVPEADLDRAVEMMRDYCETLIVERFAIYLRTSDGVWRRRREVPFGREMQ